VTAPRIAVLLRLCAGLFVTTITALDRDHLQAAPARWQVGVVQVVQVQNRGRDIAPKFVSLARAHDDDELSLHLHGKKSLHRPNGAALAAPASGLPRGGCGDGAQHPRRLRGLGTSQSLVPQV